MYLVLASNAICPQITNNDRGKEMTMMTMYRHRRTHEIKVRFDDEEYTDLMKKVSQTKLSREKFIRSCIKKTSIKMPPSIDFYKWINEFNAIGNNLNQIARKLNSNSSVEKEYCMQSLEDLNELIQKMEEEVRGF